MNDIQPSNYVPIAQQKQARKEATSAAAFRHNPEMEATARRAAAGEHLSSTQRMSLGFYIASKAAAERAGLPTTGDAA